MAREAAQADERYGEKKGQGSVMCSAQMGVQASETVIKGKT